MTLPVLLKKYVGMAISDKTYVILTHQMVYGAAHALRDYLVACKVRRILYIGHPINHEVLTNSELTEYIEGTCINTHKHKRLKKINIFSFIFDFFLSLIWVLRYGKKTDICVGLNNLNCFVGLCLKFFGRVDKVIYYSIDFTPQRLHSYGMNALYHLLEKFCVLHADEVWNTSPRIAEGRRDYLGISVNSRKQKIVPIGIWIKKHTSFPKNRKKNQILFIGHVLKKQGIQLVIKALPMILKKIPDTMLIIVGGGLYLNTIKELCTKLSLNKHVHFAGWVDDQKLIQKYLYESSIAIAPYQTIGKESDNFTYYADPTKLKDYLSGGLPIIMTNVPHNAQDIADRKSGIIVDYSEDAFADAIIDLLEDDKKLMIYQHNAFQLAKSYDWSIVFDNAFSV